MPNCLRWCIVQKKRIKMLNIRNATLCSFKLYAKFAFRDRSGYRIVKTAPKNRLLECRQELIYLSMLFCLLDYCKIHLHCSLLLATVAAVN